MHDLIHALFSRAAIGKSDWPGREFSTFVPSLAWVEGPSWRDGEQDPCVCRQGPESGPQASHSTLGHLTRLALNLS